MDIVFVGAGRLATQLAKALRKEGHTVVAIYSRTMASAETLAAMVGGRPTDSIEALPTTADAFIVAVRDAVLPVLIPQLVSGRQACPMFHTAGSMPMSVFGSLPHHGVIYPMQTFSKERDVDFRCIPVFVEASSSQALATARAIATSVSNRVQELDGEQRRYLHLAAVFACNFANHCYALAADVLQQHGLKFEDMLPLIDETARKVHELSPREAQTGPAVRYDENVINAQLELLADSPRLQEVYSLMSRSIHQEQEEA